MSTNVFTRADECWREIKDRMAAMGVEVTVSATPPIVAGTYTVEPMTCPHGSTYWFEPTGEQIADWVRDGVA